MKSKISVILLATLSFSLFSFYSVHKVKNSMNWIQNFRKLESDDGPSEDEGPSGKTTAQEIKELCQNADEKLYKYYYEEGSYDKEYETDEVDDSQTLINLIKDQNTDNIKEYIKKCAKWLAFIIFGILTIIGWVVCCVCACCGCCCFTKCCQNKIASFVTFVLCAACYGVVAILGIYTAASANRALTGLNNTSCSLLSFVDDIVNGQKRVTIPYWKGINGLKEVLNSIKKGINKTIKENQAPFYNSIRDYNKGIEDSEKNLNFLKSEDAKDINNKYYYITLPSSSKFDENNIVPICISTWDTYMIKFNAEYNGVKQASEEVLNNMAQTFDDVTGCKSYDDTGCGTSNAFDAITDSLNAVNDISKSFTNIQSDLTDPWYDVQSTINDIGKSSLKIAGSVICVFCASVCALIILFKLMNCAGKIFRIVIHILWNIVALTTIVSFVLGGLIGLLGKIGIDLVSVMNFIISKDNLNANEPEIIGKIDKADYLIRCLHKDGDLATELELEDKASSIQKLNDLKESLVNLSEIYSSQTKSTFPNEYYELLVKYYKNNFYEYEYSNNKTKEEFFINNDLKNLNDELSTCAQKEIWGNETEVSSYDSVPTANAHINIYDIKNFDYTTRYDGVCSSTDSDTIASELGVRLERITDFFTTNSQMTSLKNKEKDVKDSMDEIYKNLNKAIATSLTIISAITDKLNENVGEDGQLWGMINCKFMGDGLKVLLKNIHDGLGSRFVNLGNVLVAMAFLEVFAIIFTLITLNANSNPSSK